VRRQLTLISSARLASTTAGAAPEAGVPGWWGVKDVSRFKASKYPDENDGPTVFLAATHASPSLFLRDAAQALQVALDAALAPHADVAGALGPKADGVANLSAEARRIRDEALPLFGGALRDALATHAKAGSAAGKWDGRRVWVHSAALADVRAHGVVVRPAALDPASGGLMYDSEHNTLVEEREGECPVLLTPWGVAMTNPGKIRARDDKYDSPARGGSGGDVKQMTLEEAIREAEQQDQGAGRGALGGLPVPESLHSSRRVVVQARVVFGTLECEGARVIAPAAERGAGGAASGVEAPAGWRGRMWKQSWGASEPDGWGAVPAEGGVKGGGPVVGVAAERAEWWSSRMKEAVSSVTAAVGAAGKPAQEEPKAEKSRSGPSAEDRAAAREVAMAATKGLDDVDEEADGGRGSASAATAAAAAAGPKHHQSRAAAARAAAEEIALASRAWAAEGRTEGGRGTDELAASHWLQSMSDPASGPLAGDDGVGPTSGLWTPPAAPPGEAAPRWNAAREARLRSVMDRYTHWHEATLEMTMVRPAPRWSRSMNVPGAMAEDAEDGAAAGGKAGGGGGGADGGGASSKAASLARDVRRGVLSDAPGRRGAGPAGAPRGLEALMVRLAWAARGLVGALARSIADMSGSPVLRGPDLVPDGAGWRVVAIDEAVPRGGFEGDTRAADAWRVGASAALARLGAERGGDWTLGAEFLSAYPAAEPWPVKPARIGESTPSGVVSDVALVTRTLGPLLRHWDPRTLGNPLAAPHVRAAMRGMSERLEVVDGDEDEEEAEEEEGRVESREEGEAGQDEDGFGTAWHDGWEGLRAREVAELGQLGRGSQLGVGDGRWSARPTSMVAPWNDEDSAPTRVSMPAPPSWAVGAVRAMAKHVDGDDAERA